MLKAFGGGNQVKYRCLAGTISLQFRPTNHSNTFLIAQRLSLRLYC